MGAMAWPAYGWRWQGYRGGNSRVWEEEVTRAELHKKRDAGDFFLRPIAVLGSNNTRNNLFLRVETYSSCGAAIYLDSGFLPFDAPSEAHECRGGRVRLTWT